MFLRKALQQLPSPTRGASNSSRTRRRHRQAQAAELRGLEMLESRVLLSGNSPTAVDDAYEVVPGGTISLESSGAAASDIESLDAVNIGTSTESKPQSKVWQYGGEWWSVLSDGSDTWVWRLDDSTWVRALMVSARNDTEADVKVDGDLVHILMEDGAKTQLRSIQYAPGSANGYELWSLQPEIVKPGFMPEIETATIDIDSTGRMWMAYDYDGEIVVRYSDGRYDSWSDEIVLEDDVRRDDISVVVALPDGSIGVMWSNQRSDRFGFRRHIDGTNPDVWRDDEVPASQSALDVGGGMADDHLNVAVAEDGTLYAAVKTSYDSSGYPTMALLVRRPDGTWDDLHEVSEIGTRPIVQRNDATGELLFIYTRDASPGAIVYRRLTDDGVSVVVGPERTFIDGNGQVSPGSLNDPSGTKDGFTDELIVIADGNNGVAGTRVVVTFPPAELGILVNDSDDENDTLSAVLVEGPQHGQLTLRPDGTFVYRHDGGPSEFDSFTYLAHDGTGQSNVATVQLTVTASAPVTTTFQQGVSASGSYDGATDSYLRGDDVDRNKGANAMLKVDGSPDMASLFRWDLASSIPTGQTVTAASIRLFASRGTEATFGLYELLAPWVEDEVTFNEFADGANWETPGAQGGTDRSSTLLGSIGQIDNGFVTIDLNAAGIAVVQSWIDDPSSNRGLSILNYDDAAGDQVRFNSSEHGDASTRPRLSITHAAGTIEPNEAPEVTATGGTASYTENGAAVVIDDEILVSDADDSNLIGATAAITGGFAAGEDLLAFTSQNGIGGSYNAGSGVLTLNGTASVTDYQTALRSVTYANSSDDPSSVLRTVTFTVNDGFNTAGDSRSLSVTTINDAPTTEGIGNVAVEIDAADTEINLRAVFADAEQLAADLTFAVTSNTNPSLVTTAIDAGADTLTLSYAAAQAGSAEITLRATDSGSEFVETTFTVDVSVDPGPEPQTARFQQGVSEGGAYDGTTDAYIRGDVPDRNKDNSSFLKADGSPDMAALIRWDVSSLLSAGDTVVSASITLHVPNASDATFDLFKLLVPWVEAEVTFDEYAAGSSWETAGALGASDRAADVLGSAVAPSLGQVTIDMNAAGIAAVQSWIDDPAVNHGIALLNYDDDAANQVRFSSSEEATAFHRPQLSIGYLPGSGQNLLAAGGELESTSAGQLRESDLTPVVEAAVERLIAAAAPGERAALEAALENITVEITDLSGAVLGRAREGVIQIDVDAAGHGWFVDSTPWEDNEFGPSGQAYAGSAASGQIDLLSVLMHEKGHFLGLDHEDEGTMQPTLSEGVRRSPVLTVPKEPFEPIDRFFGDWYEFDAL